MEIKIKLDSSTIQEKYDRGGMIAILPVLNQELGYSITNIRDKVGVVYDENGNEAGTWEIVRA